MKVQEIAYNYLSAVAPVASTGQFYRTRSAQVAISTISTSGIVTTTSPHGLNIGDYVFITGTNSVADNTEANPYYTVSNVINTTRFEISLSLSSQVSGGYAIPAYLFSCPSALYTPNRLLSIYNEARYVLYSMCVKLKKYYYVRGFHKTVSISGTYSGVTTYTKPSDYTNVISLTRNNIPITIVDNISVELLRSGKYATYNSTQDGYTAYEDATSFYILAYIEGNATLDYFAFSNLTVSDIWDTTKVDGFDDRLGSLLLKTACGLTELQYEQLHDFYLTIEKQLLLL